MWQAIGAMLPFAAGVAMSPFPVIAGVLLLLSRSGRPAAVVFLVARLVCVVVTVGVIAAVSDMIEKSGSASPAMAIVRIVLGVLLIVLAVRKWGSRPADDADPKLPKWMGAIEGTSPSRAGVLAVILSVGNPKELLLNVGAGLVIGNAALALGPTIAVVVIYTVIACATVAAPVVAFVVGGERVRIPLEAARTWLVRNNTVILSVVLIVIGAALIGGGIGDL